MPRATRQTFGHELKEGDSVVLFWGSDFIRKLETYTGNLAPLMPGAKVATFASGRKMTLPANQFFDKVITQ